MKTKSLLILIITLSMSMIGPVHSYGLDIIDSNENIELVNAWRTFLKAVTTNDMRKIKDLSVERIRCLPCLDNTEEEDKEMTEYRMTRPDWYEKLYSEKIFVPVNKFCEQDYPIIFSKEFVRKLQDSEPAYAMEDLNDEKIFEIMIAAAKPGELSPGHEGGLYLFQFIKTNSGYKFGA